MTGLEHLTVWGLAWIALVVLVSGFTHGVIGFGFPILATPLLALALDIKTAILLVLLPTLAVTVISALRGGNLRASIGRYWYMPLCIAAGSYAGTRFLIGADPAPFLLVLALVLIVWLNLERFTPATTRRDTSPRAPLSQGTSRPWRERLLRNLDLSLVRRYPHPFAIVFGLAAGALEATANVAGPLLIIYFALVGLAPHTMIQALNFCFVFGKGAQFATWTAAGGITAAQRLALSPTVPLAIATLFVGERIRLRLSTVAYIAWLRRFLWLMSGLLLAQFGWMMMSRV